MSLRDFSSRSLSLISSSVIIWTIWSRNQRRIRTCLSSWCLQDIQLFNQKYSLISKVCFLIFFCSIIIRTIWRYDNKVLYFLLSWIIIFIFNYIGSFLYVAEFLLWKKSAILEIMDSWMCQQSTHAVSSNQRLL